MKGNFNHHRTEDQLSTACHEAGHMLVGGILEGRDVKYWTIQESEVVIGAYKRMGGTQLIKDIRKGFVLFAEDGKNGNLAVSFAGCAGESYENFLPDRVQTRSDVGQVYGCESDELKAWDEVAMRHSEIVKKEPDDRLVRACLQDLYERLFDLLAADPYDATLRLLARYMLQNKEECGPGVTERMMQFLRLNGIRKCVVQKMRAGLSALQIPEAVTVYATKDMRLY